MSDKDTDENDRDDSGRPEGADDDGGADAGSVPEARRDDAEQDGEAASSPQAGAEDDPEAVDLGGDTMAVTSLLGPERWVQFGFIGLAFVVFFFLDKVISLVWERFAEPDPMISAISAGIVGLLVGFFAYTNPATRKLADEVVTELSQVTWPSRDETYVSTVVVVVTSVVAALYTGMFDALWSAITDFVYTV